ncbi:MAG TPA: HlyD family efflux transporter periplasmic adaptor subunit [Planctomycetota bacterium]|jgi:multidrug efflux pump subunit AcrA (membrane-fusion protein)|nr:HlyD family efflux transporter periplasmic adaptor subunit [Planctomycetota bacterium]OQC20715.1 MAG: macrolide transporter subunit MacA [Planctomycetes bacterium ADurb.Bin069]NMD35440.1 HlyD family efflux transporter periplasmic adaptor subunit [Planctomycetota bacterium]HNR98326.1 HlyD family efflux transporter periplasmic adaptor subunit [Planctomycetota bacterium]HNU24644.1 HlyD family efflux transporter periplasmic adaptor subunit [Planctomycetota bacterium]
MPKRIIGTLACLALAAAACAADDPPATHTVAKGPFVITSELKGVFEAEHAAEVVLRPKEWRTLEVIDAVAHGTRVGKGDLLLRLAVDDLDKAIHDLRAEIRAMEIDAAQAETALQAAEKTAALDLAGAEKARRHAQENLERYIRIDRPQGEKSAQFDLKSATQVLQYEREELAQLEKMYKADELTEETEEIVLTRQRNSVERAEFALERARLQCARVLEVSLPRQLLSLEDEAARADIAWRRAQTSVPASLNKQRLAAEKTRLELRRARERLARLEADRGIMEVKAPMSGIVYYGACVFGEWGDALQAAAKLRRGGTIASGQVVFTVVDPRPLRIVAKLAEKDLEHLRAGMQGFARPAAAPETACTAILRRIDAIPLAPETFGAELTVSIPQDRECIAPGMRCAVTINAYEKRETIAVPARAVAADPFDPNARSVYLLLAEGPVKRAVKTGPRSGDRIEILEGLVEGDRILLAPPEGR